MNTPERSICPHPKCGKPNEVLEAPSGDPADLPGCVFQCDHCGQFFVVKAARPVYVLHLVPARKPT